MIVYLATDGQFYTLKWYLDHMGPPFSSRFRLMSYEELFAQAIIPAAHYIFADLERLSLDELRRAGRVRRALEQADYGANLLNDPLRSMRRYELQRALHAAGINSYNVHRATDSERPRRYPVFLRGENDHQGNLTPLLHDAAGLQAAIDTLVERGEPRDDKLIVEFTDVRDAHGRYHKCGAQVIGGQVIAVEHLISMDWVIKESTVETPEQIAAFRDYLDRNPHAAQLAGIFRLARIGYGRVDYAVKDGRIEVFEINTSPMLVDSSVDAGGPLREVGDRMFRQLQAAFEAIDTPLSRQEPVAIDVRLPTPPEKRVAARVRHGLHELLWSLGLRRVEPWLVSALRSLYHLPRRLRERQ
jgi:hypothetical protein